MRPITCQVGATSLMVACSGGYVEVVKALLGAEPKANIEAKSNVGVLSMLFYPSDFYPAWCILSFSLRSDKL